MLNPRNPVSARNNRPRENGQTRLNHGHLEYLSPLTARWEPAVRLQDIRRDVLRGANPKQYKHQKANGNGHKLEPYNYTAFLAKDRDVGSARAHRPDILFQIRTPELRSVKPDGYVKYNGRIILDPFDHGLRNFPELPVALSSELEGSDIEYYYRQNVEIADYDLIARMPNGYLTGRGGRRRHEGPPRLGTINQRAQRFRIRAACIAWCKREGTGAKNATILGMIPKECIAANSTKGFRDLTRAEVDLVERKNSGSVRRKNQNTRGDVSDDDEGNGGDDAPSQTDDEWTLTSVATPHESVEHGLTRPHPTTSLRTLPGRSSSLANPPTTIESPDVPSRMSLRPRRRAVPPPAPSTRGDSGASVDSRLQTPVRRTTMHRETGTKSLPPKTATEASSPEHEAAESSTTGRKRRHETDDEAGSDDEEFMRRPRPNPITETPYLNYYIARRAGNFAAPDSAPEDMTAEALQRYTAWTLSDLRRRRQQARQPCLPWDPDVDEEFQTETQEGIAAGDYRYFAPQDHGWEEEDQEAISRALELTRIQYSELKGHSVPGDFSQYRYESYASQWRRIQDNFKTVWTLFSEPRELYRLAKWRKGFSNWKVKKNDVEGMALLAKLEEGERALADMEEEWEEEDRLEAEEAARKKMEGEEEEA